MYSLSPVISFHFESFKKKFFRAVFQSLANFHISRYKSYI
uniref:Uncharacterized protein n=1 Tax=Anguilla anguilla TaxID=7936 RepID=A0A0E9T329_ANGAN